MRLSICIGLLAGLALPSAAQVKIDYEKHVKPLLAAKCFSCHGDKQQQSGLRLDLRQNALRGGDYGVVIVPGKSAQSKLILRLVGSTAGLQMPPSGALEEAEIGVLRAWIDQGADMPGRAMSVEKPRKPTDPKLQSLVDAIHQHDDAAVKKMVSGNRGLARMADNGGSTALMHAAYAGTLESMKTLVAAGADVLAKNDRKATVLHWAMGDDAKVKWLLTKGVDVNAKSVEGRTPLYLAAMLPAGAARVRMLLEAGADPNAKTLTGTTPLFPAVSNSIESAQLLIAKGADPNAKTETGNTPLMAAAGMSPAAVKLLISKGVDVNARTKRGETALANAANRGYLESVKMLVEKGATVKVVDYRGYTPLMHAAYCDGVNVELIQLLLSRGVDPDAEGEGETALSLAAKHGETEVTRLLRAHSQKRTKVAGNR